jgi:hypothetical protein
MEQRSSRRANNQLRARVLPYVAHPRLRLAPDLRKSLDISCVGDSNIVVVVYLIGSEL